MIREYIIRISDEIMKEEIADRPQELVRCKNCKYSTRDMFCNHPIEWDNGESRNHCNPDWFCADGEPKEGR